MIFAVKRSLKILPHLNGVATLPFGPPCTFAYPSWSQSLADTFLELVILVNLGFVDENLTMSVILHRCKGPLNVIGYFLDHSHFLAKVYVI